jgi:GDP/UDP-N,N'-diacetylbacillosamine 2-epimerase (hydrolysing)
MKLCILTSSRADYGIYLPLLEKIKMDPFFEVEIIAFGTHLSKFHGYTLNEIEKDQYPTIRTISSMVANDDEQSIATSYGLTVLKFADIWANNKYDIVLCLGDRFEMSAAIQAGIPFGVTFAHIHGGETTLGAIDNIYRHQITLASKIHFTSAETFSEKIANFCGTNKNIFTIGSLSLNSIKTFLPVDKEKFYTAFCIPNGEFALVTFHPETVSSNDNIGYADEMRKALANLAGKIFLVITMPNADTLGTAYRTKLHQLKNENSDKVLLVENFGKANYFSAIHYSKIVIGNSSSGIIEAASFGRYAVNVGDRQKGRAQSENIFNAVFTADDIIAKSSAALAAGEYGKENIYYRQYAVENIINTLKQYEEF